MRITYRNADNKTYWAKRWAAIPADQAMENLDAYPLKYALETVSHADGKILEAGCGAGRILRYFHERGHDILGMDFVPVAVEKLRAADASLQVEVGDITQLRYDDGTFRYVLAFGLYHNLEYGLEQAVAETWRVLETGGAVCASFRADNIQTRLTDWLVEAKKARKATAGQRSFHKLNLTRREFESLFESVGFRIESLHSVQNMPLLYKFALFRAPGHKVFDENLARKEGYLLSGAGRLIQNFLMRHFPDQFCNIYVLVARR